jgi:dynein heavy chain
MSKVFQGLLTAQPDSYDNQDSMIKLWVHECFRVFHDRLVDDKDRQWFKNLIVDRLAAQFGVSWSKLYKGAQNPTIFGDFMTEERYF